MEEGSECLRTGVRPGMKKRAWLYGRRRKNELWEKIGKKAGWEEGKEDNEGREEDEEKTEEEGGEEEAERRDDGVQRSDGMNT